MGRILLVDDHTIIRSGLKLLLQSELNDYIFDEASDGNTALDKITANEYQLVILDINLPGTDSYLLLQNMLKLKPQSRVLMFTMNAEFIYAKRFLQLGAKGYVRKDEPATELRQAVFAVLDNRRYISKMMSEHLAEDLSHNNPVNPFEKLSPRQFEIVQYLIQGKSISDICNIMNLHSSTVSTQKARIFGKLKVTNLVDLYNHAKFNLPS